MIYHVFANRSNIGDWLSAQAIQRLLACPVSELLCDRPFVRQTLDCLQHAGPRDLIVIGGGGLLMDYFMPFWKGFEELSQRANFCIWSVGYCEMHRKCSLPENALLSRIFARSKLCCVRDEITRIHLSGCALPEPVPCPTLTVLRELPLGHGILHVDALDNVGKSVYKQMEDTARRYAVQTGRSFDSINNLIPAGCQKTLESMITRYARADVILTGRLHGCIIGLAMGRRILAVSGDRKIESFMHAAGLDDWVVGIDQAKRIPEMFAHIDAQQYPRSFVAGARAMNIRFAAALRALIESCGADESLRGARFGFTGLEAPEITRP